MVWPQAVTILYAHKRMDDIFVKYVLCAMDSVMFCRR